MKRTCDELVKYILRRHGVSERNVNAASGRWSDVLRGETNMHVLAKFSAGYDSISAFFGLWEAALTMN